MDVMELLVLCSDGLNEWQGVAYFPAPTNAGEYGTFLGEITVALSVGLSELGITNWTDIELCVTPWNVVDPQTIAEVRDRMFATKTGRPEIVWTDISSAGVPRGRRYDRG